MKLTLPGTIAAVSALLTVSPVYAKPTVIELTQVSCQFLESENGVNHHFRSTRAQNCETINERTGATRLERAAVLRLKPGRTIFRVTNRNVPYELGFWLRGATLIDHARLPSISGGGLTLGETRDYVIELEPGEYLYSCPLNPTPNYRLVVE